MAAGQWQFTDSALTKIINNTFRLTVDAWKCGLVLSGSNIGAGSTAWSGVTQQHANANGYTTGGVDVAFTLTGSPTVNINFTSPPYWLATGGSIVARRSVIYEVGGDVFAYQLLDATNVDVTTVSGSILLISGLPAFTLASS